LIEIKANEMKLVKIGDKVPRKWMTGAKSMLHELGGKKKKVKTSGGNTAYAYSRVKLVFAPHGAEQHFQGIP
jgi:hypothetical protein